MIASHQKALRRVLNSDIMPGVILKDTCEGSVKILSRPRYIPGGWVVDAECTLWNGDKYRYCACVCNLRVEVPMEVA